MDDEIFEKNLDGTLKKKSRTKKDIQNETKTEAMISILLSFPVNYLLEHEIRAGVVRYLGGKEKNDYIVMRNHILAPWRGSIRVWLTKGQIR
jgi:[histone H3]-N6,N6-dimethyl-L-lysine4 FAD-dependent demethylase